MQVLLNAFPFENQNVVKFTYTKYGVRKIESIPIVVLLKESLMSRGGMFFLGRIQ
jgi:hypothetical protein